MSELKWGEMKNFNLQCFLDCANELVRADEVKRALWLLDNLPAFYRDNIPKEIKSLKKEIQQRICTPGSYASNPFDLNMDFENLHNMDKSFRGDILVKEVKHLNQNNIAPHVIDYGPGEFWLPMLLKKNSLNFTYQPIYLSDNAFKKAKPHFEEHLSSGSESLKIFVACEIIEHLWNEEEIRYEMEKACHLNNADIVHISTPHYTFDHECVDWRSSKKDLGHLRAYTPKEFSDVVTGMFKEYEAQIYITPVMHIRLINAESNYKNKIDTINFGY